MIKRSFILFLFTGLMSCMPTSWLKMDVLNPAEFSFPDSGKISVINSSYLPEVLHNKSNLITHLPFSEQYIFDTIIITNLFNGFFSVLNESPNEYLQNAEYEEIRTKDTTNFLGPISDSHVIYLCNTFNSTYLVSFEYYDFNRRENKVLFDGGCQINLEVPHKLIWRIYQKNGEMIDQYLENDTLYWYDDFYTNSLPELTDALREVFYISGEKFARHISPYWSAISREYFLLSRSGNDISLDKEKLLPLVSGKKNYMSFRACYNIAVLCESEDKLQESIQWLEKAYSFKHSESVLLYRDKLEKRIATRHQLDIQSVSHNKL